MSDNFKEKVQVQEGHYDFHRYMSKERWISVWHQINEVVSFNPNSVLEVGCGSGIFKNSCTTFGLNVKTLDIDKNLNPDFVSSVEEMPFEDKKFDVVCAFQVLEHMPLDVSLKGLKEMCRVAKKAVVISLPDVKTSWPNSISIPKIGRFKFVIPRPFFKPRPHLFNGEHYWEINKQEVSLSYFMEKIKEFNAFKIRTYRVHENQYHRFFIIYLSDIENV